ncbi:DNA translocase FtsK [Clostridiales bacterium COT073_COT-073]|nr:DNA translocase FtsK [Clostridiales bacterium COT073_COT-073]
MGVAAYLLPIVILVSSAYKALNQGNQRLDDKIKLALLALFEISVFAHLFTVAQPQIHLVVGRQKMFFPALANYFRVSGNYHRGGGFMGGLFGDVLLIVLGKWGALVLAILLFLAIMLLLTEISLAQLLSFLKKILHIIYGWLRQQILRFSTQLKEKAKSEKPKPEEDGWEQAIIQTELAAKSAKEQEITVFPTEKSMLSERKHSFINVDLSAQSVPAENEPAAETDWQEMKESTGSVQMEKSGQSMEELPMEESQPNDWPTPAAVDEKTNRVNPYLAPGKKPDHKMAAEAEKQKYESAAIQQEMQLSQELKSYAFPPLELLKEPIDKVREDGDLIAANIQKLEDTLQSFNVNAKVIDVSQGPTVTRYEIQPAQGVKVSRIVSLADDIALSLAATGIRMEAPIPGKSAIGIEIPNQQAGSVLLREVIDSAEFKNLNKKLAFGLGKDISGRVLVTDIGKMPHLLIAGATGSGKSVCINTLIVSLLYKAKPEEVRLLMIDPKVVELSIYNGIPHLMIPVVTDPKKAAGALNWAVQEMNDRYKLFAAIPGIRDLQGYNKVIEEKGDTPKLPQIVIIVDELADLMMAASSEVEDAICRLAQMARAAGIHLIIATQRPSVDVITGLIKANIPSRIAFNVSSGIDSRTILDMNGAEKLLGKGDMLFYPTGYPKPVRIQGAFVSDHEVENIVEYLKTQQQTQYNQKIMNHLNKSEDNSESEQKDDLDELFADALELVVEKERASASMIQRYFRVGFNRAARIIDQLTEAGYVGEEQGSKPRDVLLTRRELEELKARANQPKPATDELGTEKNDFGAEDIETENNAPEREQVTEQIITEPVAGDSFLESSELMEKNESIPASPNSYQVSVEDEPVNDMLNQMLEEIQARED